MFLKERSKEKDEKVLLIRLAGLFTQPRAKFTLIYGHAIATLKRYLPLGTFIPGRLGTSLAACRDSNKHGGRVTRMVNANSSRGIDQVLSFAP